MRCETAARWHSIDPQTAAVVPYDDKTNELIEQHLKFGTKTISITIGGARYTIDFQQMQQENDRGGCRKIERIVCAIVLCHIYYYAG